MLGGVYGVKRQFRDDIAPGAVQTRHGETVHHHPSLPVPIALPAGINPSQVRLDEEQIFEEFKASADFEWGYFCLWDQEQGEKYRRMKDGEANGFIQVQHEERIYYPQYGRHVVYLEWISNYMRPDRRALQAMIQTTAID